MRSEQQVLSQILAFARENELIRAVWMNGSRVNPNIQKDIFCDYDVACAVTDVRPLFEDQSWINRFGEPVIVQVNEFNDFGSTGYIFLMLFMDGVRIDLAFDPLETMAEFLKDSLTVVLLDKDGRIPPLPPPSEADYLTPPPSRKEYDETVNEFFFCANNFAKGAWRGDLTYAKTMYDGIVHPCLVKILIWYAGAQTGWQAYCGYHGKWLRKYLPAEMWTELEKTYADADEGHMWDALFAAGRLARWAGTAVAEALGYDYPYVEDERMTDYCRRVRNLPKGADHFE